MQHVILGTCSAPTEAQERLACKTGGWAEVHLRGAVFLWNACVSPPFAGCGYNLNKTEPNEEI